MVEVLGYVASAVIVLSLTMTSILRLRLIGLFGAALFAVYGYLVDAFPVVLTNLVILGLHVFFLWRAWMDEEFFTLLEVRPESHYLEQFLEFHGEDIRRFQPAFVHDPAAASFALFILRDMVPAGVLRGRPQPGGVLDVELDYVTPRYRDMKAARFLFDYNRGAFFSRGITALSAVAETDAHRRYLERIGFHGTGAADRFELRLPA
jgi:hypothetical protein